MLYNFVYRYMYQLSSQWHLVNTLFVEDSFFWQCLSHDVTQCEADSFIYILRCGKLFFTNERIVYSCKLSSCSFELNITLVGPARKTCIMSEFNPLPCQFGLSPRFKSVTTSLKRDMWTRTIVPIANFTQFRSGCSYEKSLQIKNYADHCILQRCLYTFSLYS